MMGWLSNGGVGLFLAHTVLGNDFVSHVAKLMFPCYTRNQMTLI
jgi:hypothetical protein